MKNLLFRVNLISAGLMIVLFTDSVGYAKVISPSSFASNCGEWIIESASLNQDRRLGVDLTQQATGDNCYGIVTLKNQTGIPIVSGYTLALTSSSSNANVQFVPDPILVPGLNIDVKITPTDLSKVASVTLQSGVTIGSATLDASLWLIKSLIDLAPLPTGCIVSNDQLVLLALRTAPILEKSVRLAFEGNLGGAQLEFKRVLPEYGQKATELLLRDIPLGCAADGLKAILKKPFVLFKIGFAYGAWLATVFFDYFEYQGLSVGPAVILSYVPSIPPIPEAGLNDIIAYIGVDSFGNEVDVRLVKPDGSSLRILPLDDVAPEKFKPSCWPISD